MADGRTPPGEHLREHRPALTLTHSALSLRRAVLEALPHRRRVTARRNPPLPPLCPLPGRACLGISRDPATSRVIQPNPNPNPNPNPHQVVGVQKVRLFGVDYNSLGMARPQVERA